MDDPLQMVDERGVIDACGEGITFTTTWSVEEQCPKASVTVSVYVVVAAGLANGLDMLVALRPVDGLQEYNTPPDPDNCVLLPLQIVTSVPAFATTGEGCPMTIPDCEIAGEQLPMSCTHTE